MGKWKKDMGRKDPTRLKHDPFMKPHRDGTESIQSFNCACCDKRVILTASNKIEADILLLAIVRQVGAELCDDCIVAGVRKYNLAERRKGFVQTGKRE